MRRLGLTILIFALLALPSVALAQDGTSYSLASAQETKNLQVIPGEEPAQGVIYFYNVAGNKITHITLEVVPVFSIILKEIGANRTQVIEVVQEVTTLELEEAENLVESAPTPVKEDILEEKAETIKQKLEAVGATVEIKQEIEVEEIEHGKLYQVSWGNSHSWEVEIDPPLDEQEYSVGGQTIYVTENLFAEPTEPSAEEIKDIPSYCQEHEYVYSEDMVCLTVPNLLGDGKLYYVLAKPVYIIVSVPESEEIGTEGNIRIYAEGGPPGPTGTVTVALTRDFDFTVSTVYELTNEKPITGGGFDVGRWLPVIIAGTIVILAAVLLPRFVIRRREG